MSTLPTPVLKSDAQAIKRVAESYYGGYRNMFDAHGWSERNDQMIADAPRRIIQTYGSVQSFEEKHALSELMFPIEAIKSDPPNVWITSFYGFRPEEWGFLGFTKESARNSFLNRSKPGVLVAVYGTERAAKDERGKVIGILQCSHETGHAERFMSPAAWARKDSSVEDKGRWNYAVKAVRAWRISPESRMDVKIFAPEATRTGAWEHIGAQGEPLMRKEALNIFKFDLQEVDVCGETPIIASVIGTAKEILAPSRAGPVSQNPYTVRESEGPKHLYLLRLVGDTDAFLGEPARGHMIVKAGFSKSPQTRRDDYNRALPRCAFHWEVLHSGLHSGWNAYPSSGHARCGELAMQTILKKEPDGRSLDGEFFLASKKAIEAAWIAGNKAAKEFKK